jgi:hypothetical protein
MTKLEAKTLYRWAFAHWRRATSESERRPHERTMDELQSKIASRPGREWSAFIDTIPGYREAWNGMIQQARDAMQEKSES